MSEQLQRSDMNSYLLLAGAIVGGIALGKACSTAAKQEKTHQTGENVFDIIQNIDNYIIREIGVDTQYFMMGGCSSSALADPRTRIDEATRRIIPPQDIHKDQFRRENGSQTDIDILVLSSDQKVVDGVRRALTPDHSVLTSELANKEEKQYEHNKPGAKLKVGVTGLLADGQYQPNSSLKDKIKGFIKNDWVSYRTITDDNTIFFRIADIKAALPESYFEPWYLQLKDGNCVPVFHPMIQVLCYLSRTSHGIRKRDINKVQSIMDNFGHQFSALLTWDNSQHTGKIQQVNTSNEGIEAAVNFVIQKNNLRWKNTKERIGKNKAALLAARIAIHRRLDNSERLTALGQEGWIYDNILSRISGERQQKL
jgi:hypothetical protein